MKFEFKQNLENFLDLWQLLGCEPPGIVVSVSERVICLKGSYSLDLKDCFALPAFAIRLEMKNTQVRTENNSYCLESNQDHNMPHVDNPQAGSAFTILAIVT